jgi:hypothetical protein
MKVQIETIAVSVICLKMAFLFIFLRKLMPTFRLKSVAVPQGSYDFLAIVELNLR